MERTVLGVFRSHDDAEKAVRELRDKGFRENEISIVAKEEGRGRAGGREEGGATMRRGGGDVGEGVWTGGALGGLGGLLLGAGALTIPGIGPVVAAGPIAGALTGAVTGGIAGGLIDWGIPEERGRHFEERVRRGDVLALVRTSEGKVGDATKILRDNGAEDVEAH